MVVLAEQARPEVAQSAREQAGHLHLGEAKLLADLGLRHATVVIQHHDLLLAHWQFTPVSGDRVHAQHVIEPGVFLADEFSQAGRA